MAVGPHQILQVLSAKDANLLSRLEKKLDEHLKEEYQGKEMWIDVDFFDNAPERVMEKLVTKYRVVGWRVVFDSDRDGSCYKFSAETPSYYNYGDR
jgi:hypothetical protein